MSAALRFATGMAEAIAERSASSGRRVTVDPAAVLDRSDAVRLARPGEWSANGSCRLLRAADGWIGISLARTSDRDLLPAWLGGAVHGDEWIQKVVARRTADLTEAARLVGLPVASVGEAAPALPEVRRMAAGGSRGQPTVVDLSSLWAGPLCAALLADAGLAVTKVESRARPDTTGERAPAQEARLNGAKRRVTLDFASVEARATLKHLVETADVVVTGARQRAFAPLGIAPEAVFAVNPRLVWVAITGHGWDSERVAFGDDAAAAGGLVRWTEAGEPRFVGDALADPLTGLAAAAAAFEALARGGGVLIDAAMAPVAAMAATA